MSIMNFVHDTMSERKPEGAVSFWRTAMKDNERGTMELRLQSEADIIQTYNTRMKKDFPPSELKPLESLLQLSRSGAYLCYGVYDAGSCLAYAYFMKHPTEPVMLLDYFAVAETGRGQGIGSCAMNLLREKLEPGVLVIIEAEALEWAEDEEQRQIRERRLAFYKKNGMLLTDIVAEAFDVAFAILVNNPCKAEKICRCYLDMYHAMIPKEHYSRVKILSA